MRDYRVWRSTIDLNERRVSDGELFGKAKKTVGKGTATFRSSSLRMIWDRIEDVYCLCSIIHLGERRRGRRRRKITDVQLISTWSHRIEEGSSSRLERKISAHRKTSNDCISWQNDEYSRGNQCRCPLCIKVRFSLGVGLRFIYSFLMRSTWMNNNVVISALSLSINQWSSWRYSMRKKIRPNQYLLFDHVWRRLLSSWWVARWRRILFYYERISSFLAGEVGADSLVDSQVDQRVDGFVNRLENEVRPCSN